MGLGILLVMAAIGGAIRDGVPVVRYELIALSAIPRAELVLALTTMEGHFRRAGVELRRDESGVHAGGGCGGTMRIYLLGDRTFRGSRPPRDVLGYTSASAPGEPPAAMISYERVAAVSSRRQLRAGLVLGHVLSHELGHLLLGRGAHGGAHLMKSTWTIDQLLRLAQGGLLFSPDEVRRLRGRSSCVRA